MKIIKEIIPYIVILIVVILVRMYLITPVTVVGSSMDPTLHDKQMLILSKISYKIHDIERFDIVVIKKENEEIIKRVIGLPGEYISYEDNKLYVNGEYVCGRGRGEALQYSSAQAEERSVLQAAGAWQQGVFCQKDRAC